MSSPLSSPRFGLATVARVVTAGVVSGVLASGAERPASPRVSPEHHRLQVAPVPDVTLKYYTIGEAPKLTFEYTDSFKPGAPWSVPHRSSDLPDWPPVGSTAPMKSFSLVDPHVQEGVLRFRHDEVIPDQAIDNVVLRLRPSEQTRPAWRLTPIAENGVQESRRPHAVGLYASEVNRTFLSWSGPGSQPCVMAYDHATGEYSSIADPAGDVDIRADKHNYPALILTKDGYLHVFTMRGRLLHFRSPAPYTIEGEWESHEAPAQGSYQFPVVTSAGDVFVFFRDGTSGVSYLRSTDHGRSWEPVRKALTVDDDEEHLDTIYPGGLTLVPGKNGEPDRLLLGWTRSGKGPKYPDGYYDSFHKDAFVAWFDCATRRFSGYDGFDLGEAVSIAEMKAHCRVLDTGDPAVGDPKAVGYFFVPVALDDSGIALAFEYWKDSGGAGMGARNDTASLLLARWDGSVWKTQTFANLVNPDLERDDDGSLRLYGFRYTSSQIGRGGVFYVMRSLDQGLTWHLEALLEDPERPLTRCYVIENARPEMKVILNEWGPEFGENNGRGFYRIYTAGLVESKK